MPTTYRTEVLHANVNRLFLRGGPGYRFMDSLRAAMHRRCEAEAPVGGPRPDGSPAQAKIRGSHRSSARGRNGYRTDVEISNIAPHAEYVHNGTTGPIRPRTKSALLTPYGPRKSVSGQRANPWMERACVAVSRTRGAVGG
jgi:hypothetical protein